MRYSIIFASLAVVAFAAPVPQSQQANANAEFIDRELNVEALPKDDTTWSERNANVDPIIFNNRPDFEAPSNNVKESRSAEPTMFNGGRWSTNNPKKHKPQQRSVPRSAEPTMFNGGRWSTNNPKKYKPQQRSVPRSAEPTMFNGGRWSEKKPNKPKKNNGQRRSAAALNDEALEFVDVEIHDQDEADFDTDSGAGNVPRAFNCNRCGSRKPTKPKRQMIDRPESSDIASEPFLRDSRPEKPGKPNKPTKGPRSNANIDNEDKPSSEAVDPTTESVNVAGNRTPRQL